MPYDRRGSYSVTATFRKVANQTIKQSDALIDLDFVGISFGNERRRTFLSSNTTRMLLWLFLAVLAVYYAFKNYILVLWKRGVGELPPGPLPLPILGNALSMDSEKPYESIDGFAKKYGKIFSVMLGSQLTIFIADLQLVKKAFKDDRFSARPRTIFHLMGFADGELIMVEFACLLDWLMLWNIQ